MGVGTGSIALCGLLVFAVITGAIMIRKEDAELEARFGEQYREYRERRAGSAAKNSRSSRACKSAVSRASLRYNEPSPSALRLALTSCNSNSS